MAMAMRMDGLATSDTAPEIRDAWTRMARRWRDLARQADWQDGYTACDSRRGR
jgi:hypothetical protein